MFEIWSRIDLRNRVYPKQVILFLPSRSQPTTFYLCWTTGVKIIDLSVQWTFEVPEVHETAIIFYKARYSNSNWYFSSSTWFSSQSRHPPINFLLRRFICFSTTWTRNPLCNKLGENASCVDIYGIFKTFSSETTALKFSNNVGNDSDILSRTLVLKNLLAFFFLVCWQTEKCKKTTNNFHILLFFELMFLWSYRLQFSRQSFHRELFISGVLPCKIH